MAAVAVVVLMEFPQTLIIPLEIPVELPRQIRMRSKQRFTRYRAHKRLGRAFCKMSSASHLLLYGFYKKLIRSAEIPTEHQVKFKREPTKGS